MSMNDQAFLIWIYERCENVYHVSRNADWMRKLCGLIRHAREDIDTPPYLFDLDSARKASYCEDTLENGIELAGAPQYLNDAFDMIDACVFTGDDFVCNKQLRDHFRNLMARWERGIRSSKNDT